MGRGSEQHWRFRHAHALISRRALFESLENRWMLSVLSPQLPFNQTPLLEDVRKEIHHPPFSPFNNPSLIAADPPPPGLPLLNSRPGAPTAIYLDFDGDTTGGNTTPYDTDDNPASFNTNEAADITRCWQDIAVYFAPFDVNVTTVFPDVPFAWEVIGNNIVGGFSQIGVFPNSIAQSFNESEHARTRTSGIAHEIGHNFGLLHQSTYDSQGNKIQEYASAADPLHGVIMGLDYEGIVHKWRLGHSSSEPDTLQDDIAIIAARIAPYQDAGGDGFRPDDFGNTIATATTLPAGTAGVQSIGGIIERLNDIDAFSFTSAGGIVSLAAVPTGVSGVDLKLSIYRPDGSLVAVKDEATNDQHLNLVLSSGTYYALVSSHGNYGDIGQYDLSLSQLPAGWTAQDIGMPHAAGIFSSYTAATGTFYIGGSGSDIWNMADGFRYVSIPINGNGSITTRILSQQRTDQWAKAGVMFRETLAAGSKNVWLGLTPDHGVRLQVRANTNASTTQPNGVSATAPTWVRLTRNGSSFTAERSTNGVSWTTVGTVSCSMTSSIYVGLAVSAHNTSLVSQASFDPVALTGNVGPPPPVTNGLPAPGGLTVTPNTGTGFNLSWNDINGETGYGIDRSSDGVNFTQIGTTGANQTSFQDLSLPGSLRYFYRVVALNASGQSVPSAISIAVNRPSAPSNPMSMSIGTNKIVLDWRDTDGEAGYRIERSGDNINFSPLATVPVNTPSYTDSSLAPGTRYYYRIIPINSLGDGPFASLSPVTNIDPVTGLAAVGAQPSQIQLIWNAIDGALHYRVERSLDGMNYSTVANPVSAQYTDSAVVPLEGYYYRVTAVGASVDGPASTPVLVATPSTAPLPLRWNKLDIGPTFSVTAAGGNTQGTSFTLINSSASEDPSSDAYTFVFQQMSGDGEIVAQITSQEISLGSELAGIVFRESLSTHSASAMMWLTATHALFRSRQTNGQNTVVVPGQPLGGPRWLRLVRSGNNFTGYESSDGSNWTLVGSVSVPMSSDIYVGLFDTSGSSSRQSKVVFADVGGSALNQPDNTPPPAPVIQSIVSDTGLDTNDRITNDNTPLISGTAEPGSFVTVSATGIGVLGTVQTGGDGLWQLDREGAPIADGVYQITASATDASNNVGPLSTAVSWAIDTIAPTVSTPSFIFETEQAIVLSFSEEILSPFSPSGLVLHNQTTNQTFFTSIQFNPASLIGKFKLFTGQLLPDGNYRATLTAGSFTDIAGNSYGSNLTFDFFVLAGDANRDRTVNLYDLVILATNWQGTGKTFIQGDFNYDGVVTSADLGVLALKWQQRLDPPVPSAPVSATVHRVPLRAPTRIVSGLL